jgi:recombinational DNA repair protein RecT
MKHAFVVSFNTNVGTKQNPQWEKRATLLISGYGELQMRMRQGQIKYADNPVLVFEGDKFSYGTRNGHPYVDHEAMIPRKTDNIVACYIRLERNDGSVDYKVMSIEEVMKLKSFSKDPNSKAWTDGLPGMVQAKTIKHAFRSYPKIRMGEFSTLQSQVVDTEVEQAPKIDYGLNGSMPAPATDLPEAVGTFQPTMVVEPAEHVNHGAPVADDDFASKPAQSAGKRFESDEF